MVPGEFPLPHNGLTITAPSSQPGGAVSFGELKSATPPSGAGRRWS